MKPTPKAFASRLAGLSKPVRSHDALLAKLTTDGKWAVGVSFIISLVSPVTEATEIARLMKLTPITLSNSTRSILAINEDRPIISR